MDNNDDYELETEIPLPPLPLKPQKTLHSFFGTKSLKKTQTKALKVHTIKKCKNIISSKKNNDEINNVTIDTSSSDDSVSNRRVTRNIKRRSRHHALNSDDDYTNSEAIEAKENQETLNNDNSVSNNNSSRKRRKRKHGLESEDDSSENHCEQDRCIKNNSCASTNEDFKSKNRTILNGKNIENDLKGENEKKESVQDEIGLMEGNSKEKRADLQICEISHTSGNANQTDQSILLNPAPFPVFNHTNQLDGKVPTMLKNNESAWSKKLEEKEKSIEDGLKRITYKGNFKGLINLTLQNNEVPEEQTVNHNEGKQKYKDCTLDDYLNIIENEYPEFPIKKIFQQYLQCQKHVITQNLKRIEESQKAVEKVWEKDAEIKSNEVLSNDKQEKVKEVILPTKKEGKDIRKMFDKTRMKSSKKTNAIDKNDQGNLHCDKPQKEPLAEVKDQVVKKCKENDSRERNIHERNKTEYSINESYFPRGKEGSVSIACLFNKVQKKKEERRMKKKNQASQNNACENSEKIEKENDKELERSNDKHGNTVENNILESKNHARRSTLRSRMTNDSEFENKDSECNQREEYLDNTNSIKKRDSKDLGTMFSIQKSKVTQCDKDQETSFINANISLKNNKVEESNTDVLANEEYNQLDSDGSQTAGKDIRSFFQSNQKKKSKLLEKKLINDGNNKNSIEPCDINRSNKTSDDDISLETEGVFVGKPVSDSKSLAKLSDFESCPGACDNTPSIERCHEKICSENNDLYLSRELFSEKENNEKQCNEFHNLMENEIKSSSADELPVIKYTKLCEMSNKKRKRLSGNIFVKKMKTAVESEAEKEPSENETYIDISAESDVPRRRSIRRKMLEDVKLEVSHNQLECKYEVEVKAENDTNNSKIKVNESSAKEECSTNKEIKNENKNESNTPLRRSSRVRKTVVTYSEEKFEKLDNDIIDKPIKSKDNKKSGKTAKEHDSKDLSSNEMDSSLVEIDQCNKKVKSKTIAENVTFSMIDESLDQLNYKRVKPTVELIYNNDTINSFLTWAEKYQPTKARYVIGDKERIRTLFDWLNLWKEKHESIIKKLHAKAIRKYSKSQQQSNSDFSSDDESDNEELLSNVMLLTGPIGCGTTTSVHACAKQMNFKVLELNSSVNRTGKYIFDTVSEAVVSHQVGKGFKKNGKLEKELSEAAKGSQQLKKLFSHIEKKSNTSSNDYNGSSSESIKIDEMTLVLFEQADIIFNDIDKGFWQGIEDLRRLSKRPIILTANDSSIYQHLNTEEERWTDHIMLSREQSHYQILPFIQLMCLVEQVFIPKEVLSNIIEFCKFDIRKIIQQLHFWFDQGKKPLFSLKKLRNKVNENLNQNGMEVESENANSSELSQEQEEEVVLDGISSILDKSDIDPTALDCKEDICISVCGRYNPYPWNHKEYFFNKHKIQSCNLFGKKREQRHHSFMKQTIKDLCEVSIMSNAIDHLTDLDLVTSPYKNFNIMPTNSKFRCFETFNITDSLNDALPSKKEQIFPYPSTDFVLNALSTSKHLYDDIGKYNTITSTFDQLQSRSSENQRTINDSITSKFLSSSVVASKDISLDILPTLKNICQSEEIKRTSHRKRNARRFLHYLDSIDMFIDDSMKDQLATYNLKS